VEKPLPQDPGHCEPDAGTAGENSLPFEEALRRWEEIVELLERGSLSLEESLRLYEEGMRLRNICYARLHEAEGKMKVLRQAADGTMAEEEVAE
jgi:exodeoxyribonuclease VII small subunit